MIYRGHTWSGPLSGKSSSENTIQVVLLAVIIWINPSGVVVVSTLIWLKARIKAFLWVLDDTNKLQIEIRAWVLYNYLKTSSSSLLTSSWEATPSNGLTAGGGGGTILPLRVTICISLPSESSSSGHKVNGTMLSWYLITKCVEWANWNSAPSGIKLNGARTRRPNKTPSTSLLSCRTIGLGNPSS